LKKIITSIVVLFLFLPTILVSKVEASTQDDLIEIAKEYLGVPYKYGGTTAKGFDCSGYTKFVFEKIGIELPRISADQAKEGTKIENKDDLDPGDLVFFKNTTSKKGITHVGIYIGDNEFVSATSSKGIAIVSMDNSYWKPKYVYATRVIEEEELPPGHFQDVPKDNPAFQAITELSQAGYINGVDGINFSPEAPVTRGQAALILNRKLKLPVSTNASFKDVAPGSEVAKAVLAMKQVGIIQGFEDGTFRPNDKLTRAQMAMIMDRAFKISASTNSLKVNTAYKDVTSGFWAYDSIIALKSIDTTKIFHSATFRASHQATRAEFAAATYVSIKASGK
jgi:hypothetical protein